MVFMMSCHKKAFHMTGPLWGESSESTGHQWTPPPLQWASHTLGFDRKAVEQTVKLQMILDNITPIYHIQASLS